jgi:uncharacterized DUF497 family protein
MRKQRILLKHRVDLAKVRRRVSDVYAVHLDSAFVRHDEPRNQAEHGRFAAAGRAEEGEEFTVLNIEIDMRKRDVAAVCLRYVDEPIRCLSFITGSPSKMRFGTQNSMRRWSVFFKNSAECSPRALALGFSTVD